MAIFDQLSLKLSPEDEDKKQVVLSALKERYQHYRDPWGFNLETIEQALNLLLPLYRNYFKVRVFGQENVENIPYMVVSNHTGQLPIDGMLITIAFVFDIAPARVLRGMIERFMASLPFLADLTAQTGSILGDRSNCNYLIENGESILVFPEGVRGISKNTSEFYQLQSFSYGFYRIAINKNVPVLPIAVIGAEEMFPFVYQAKAVAKFLKLPSLPLSANAIPLPTPIDIHIGKPITIPDGLDTDAPDNDLKPHIEVIHTQIKELIQKGLEQRRDPFIKKFTSPIEKFFSKDI
jgi:1-acyl-sn-glycerol-3-phosphate acyltransferase